MIFVLQTTTGIPKWPINSQRQVQPSWQMRSKEINLSHPTANRPQSQTKTCHLVFRSPSQQGMLHVRVEVVKNSKNATAPHKYGAILRLGGQPTFIPFLRVMHERDRLVDRRWPDLEKPPTLGPHNAGAAVRIVQHIRASAVPKNKGRLCGRLILCDVIRAKRALAGIPRPAKNLFPPIGSLKNSGPEKHLTYGLLFSQ